MGYRVERNLLLMLAICAAIYSVVHYYHYHIMAPHPEGHAALGPAAPGSTLVTVEHFFPPAKYDRHYTGGPVTVSRDISKCPKIAYNSLVMGCSYMFGATCAIFVTDDNTLFRAKLSKYDVIRHEEAHCNGWGASHPGLRTRAEAS